MSWNSSRLKHFLKNKSDILKLLSVLRGAIVQLLRNSTSWNLHSIRTLVQNISCCVLQIHTHCLFSLEKCPQVSHHTHTHNTYTLTNTLTLAYQAITPFSIEHMQTHTHTHTHTREHFSVSISNIPTLTQLLTGDSLDEIWGHHFFPE